MSGTTARAFYSEFFGLYKYILNATNMMELLLGDTYNYFFPLKLKLGCISEKSQLHSHFHADKCKHKESLKFNVAKANIIRDGNDNKKIAVFSHLL